MNEEVRHFSLRKLSIGLASVLVGVSIFGASQTVKADTVADQTNSAVTNNTQSSDTQENKNVVESSFSSDNQADNAQSNATQTQENEQKQVQTENGQQDSVPQTQETTDSNDLQEKSAEKDIVSTSSLQKTDNQSNTVTKKTVQHDTLESGQKTQSFNLPKNSKKLAKKVLATNLIETTSSPTTNGGFDEATWGKLDVSNWQGSVQNGLYQLTSYTGDLSHIIVPNEADFEKAGKSTNGLQVGITRDTIHSLLSNQTQMTIAFSKTNNQKVKAIGTNWSKAFSVSSSPLIKFDGSSLDVSNVTNMNSMFQNNQISDLSSLASWNVSNVTNMDDMFWNNQISDLSPLANWNTDNVTDMSAMFNNNQISDLSSLASWDVSNVTNMGWMFSYNKVSDLTPLAHWDTSNVTDMGRMFQNNQISDLSSLASWDVSNVTNMNSMFDTNQISDLTPLTSWNTSKVTDMGNMFAKNPDLKDSKPIANWNMSSISVIDQGLDDLFASDTQLDLTNINNTPLMQGFLKTRTALRGATFITSNTDLVKAVVGQDLPTLTNTAKRTITFNIPNATPTTIVQIINYKAVAPVQIDWPAPTDGGPAIMGSSADGGVTILGPSDAGAVPPVQADSDSPKIVKTYPVKESDWQLDTSKQNDDVIIDGVIRFKPVKIPHINGYKAYIVQNKSNPALFTVSFIAVPAENKPTTPVEVAPSKPSAPTDHPNNSAWTDLDHKVVNALNQADSGWTMPADNSTYKVEVPVNDVAIDLSDLVIAQPVHAQTRTQIRVNKRFKLRKHGKKHAVKHFKQRKKAARTFKKYRL